MREAARELVSRDWWFPAAQLFQLTFRENGSNNSELRVLGAQPAAQIPCVGITEWRYGCHTHHLDPGCSHLPQALTG